MSNMNDHILMEVNLILFMQTVNNKKIEHLRKNNGTRLEYYQTLPLNLDFLNNDYDLMSIIF